MTASSSSVTIHMAASLDGFVARADGSIDWMETNDDFAAGEALEPATVEQFLQTIDCYVPGARTYETAAAFAAQDLGWAYGGTPTFALPHRELPRARPSVEFVAGDLSELVERSLRLRFRSTWFVGGPTLCAECLRLGLADELRVSVLPVVLGTGLSLLHGLERTVALHLVEVKAYRKGIVALRHEVRR